MCGTAPPEGRDVPFHYTVILPYYNISNIIICSVKYINSRMFSGATQLLKVQQQFSV